MEPNDWFFDLWTQNNNKKRTLKEAAVIGFICLALIFVAMGFVVVAGL